jgi:riboflavin kinase/FMN adenylyltransferase
MQLIDNTTTLRPEPCVATVGFFDGVHSGHRYLIEQVKREAAARGLRSAIITFAVHPRCVVHPSFTPVLLTTVEEKVALLGETGPDYCVVLDFDAAMANLSARDFMAQVLKERLNVRCLIMGHDHRFGKNRSATPDDYRAFGMELGIGVIRAGAFALDGMAVSSSFVRGLLLGGDIATANRCMSHSYAFTGLVVGGHRVGRKIGFPTANVSVNNPFKLIPANGAYAVRVAMPDGSTPLGMLNIGHRPTVNNGSERSIEVHIIGFEGDIYGAEITVTFLSHLRSEVKFGSMEALATQLTADRQAVISRFATEV